MANRQPTANQCNTKCSDSEAKRRLGVTQRGLALLELMLVVAVVAVGTAGVVATYRVVENNRKVNREVENLITIVQNIVDTSAVTGDYSTISQEGALLGGIFPNEMLDNEGNPKNSWGGDVLVGSDRIKGDGNWADWGATLTFENVPAEACSKLVTQAASSFYEVSVNKRSIKSKDGPINVKQLSSSCRDGGYVQFTYAKHGGGKRGGSPGAGSSSSNNFGSKVDTGMPGKQTSPK